MPKPLHSFLDDMFVHCRVIPSIKFTSTNLYTWVTWVKRGVVRIKCLSQEHNTMPQLGIEPGLHNPFCPLIIRVNLRLSFIIIHQTHYQKSDWSRAFNQFTIGCELDMTNALSAADIAFIMSSSTSAWLLSPLECSPQKQNGLMLRFCF